MSTKNDKKRNTEKEIFKGTDLHVEKLKRDPREESKAEFHSSAGRGDETDSLAISPSTRLASESDLAERDLLCDEDGELVYEDGDEFIEKSLDIEDDSLEDIPDEVLEELEQLNIYEDYIDPEDSEFDYPDAEDDDYY